MNINKYISEISVLYISCAMWIPRSVALYGCEIWSHCFKELNTEGVGKWSGEGSVWATEWRASIRRIEKIT